MDTSFFLTPSARAPVTSTPLRSATQPSKKKAGFVRPVCDICQTCGKEYRCHRSFLKHQRGHTIVEKASKFPKIEEITQHLCDSIGNAFEEIKSNAACFLKGQQYKGFIQLLIDSHTTFGDLDEWNQFRDIIHQAITNGLQESRFLLPSSLTAVLQRNVENLLSDIQVRKQLSALFQVFMPSTNEEMFQFLLADYALFLVSNIIQFVSECVRRTITAPLVIEKGMEVMDNDYLESVYYIAGSKIRAFYKKSQRFPKNKGWQNIGRVILERLLESDIHPGPPANVKGWTTAQDRGKLFFLSGLVFDFFCGVVVILEKQNSKKKVDYFDVTEKVCQSGVVLLWDEAVGDSMLETASFTFMNGLIEAFCQTFTVGKAQRMLNSVRKKAEAAIPLRHQVAPKTSRNNPSTSK